MCKRLPLCSQSLKLQRFIVCPMIFARNLCCNRKNIWLRIRKKILQQAQLHEWCWDYGYSYPVSFRGRCFKHYYKGYVCKHIRHLFLNLVSYNRFVELEKEIQLPLTISIKKLLLGTCTGISFADSTPLHVCRNQRILIHKTFEGLAERGKCSMGWLFGFELHLIINDKGGKSSISCLLLGMWMTGNR